MNYTDATAEVRARLQELSADFWTAAEVQRAIDEAVQRFSQEEKWPWLYTVRTGVSLTANTATLAIQSGIAYNRHFNILMTFSGDNRPRHPMRVSPDEGARLRTRYYTSMSEPVAYYLYSEAGTGASGAASGQYQTTIRFVPALTRAATLEFQYIRDPVLGTTTAHLDVPEEYVMGVLGYATGHLLLKELRYSNKADEQFALYRKAVEDAKLAWRKLSQDSGFGWGRNQPEFGFVSEDAYTEMVTPPLLGP